MHLVSARQIYCFLVISWFFNTFLFSGTYKIVEKSENRIRLQFKVPPPDFVKSDTSGTEHTLVDLPGWENIIAGGYQFPFTAFSLYSNSPKTSAKIIAVSEKKYRLPPPQPLLDIPLGDTSYFAQSPPLSQGFYPSQNVICQPAGRYRGNNLFSVQVFPIRYDFAGGQFIVCTQITLDIFTDAPDAELSLGGNEAELSFIQSLGGVTLSRGKTYQNKISKKSIPDSKTQCKIFIDADGIYRINGKDLQSAGLTLLNIDIRTLELKHRGISVPVYVKGWQDGQFHENDYFEFWGTFNRQTMQDKSADLYQDPFSQTNVYWLSWGGKKGRWIAEEQNQENFASAGYYRPFTYYHTEHVEKNDYYDRLNLVPLDSVRDHWYFDTGIGPQKKRSYSFTLPYPDEQSPLAVRIKIAATGRTNNDTLRHSMSAYINDSYIDAANWYGQHFITLETPVTATITGAELKHGMNNLTIMNTSPPDQYNYIMLNWFEVEYPRLYRADNNFIKFTTPPEKPTGSLLFQIDGFTTEKIDLYKLGISKIIGAQIEQIMDRTGALSYQVSFYDNNASAETEYVAVTASEKKKPIKIIKDRQSYLKNPDISADYLIISHRRFVNLPALDKLVKHHQDQGFRVLKIDVQDIFDEFNDGIISPFAIKSFLTYAYENWHDPKPQYILLVGDGCYQSYKYNADGDSLEFLNLVPVYMRQTYGFGAAASDHWYTLMEGDDEIPDLYIGRLPVRYPDQLEALVSKIIDAETTTKKEEWCNRLVYIGGDGSIFRTQGEELADRVPARYDNNRLYTFRDSNVEFDPYFGGSSELFDYFNRGSAVISFHGHGGGAIWADQGLLTLENIHNMHADGRYPLILSMTCFTGAFESPSNNSLADAMLFAPEEGTTAMFGASGTGWLSNDHYLLKEILDHLYANPQKNLGEIITAGKTNYYIKYFGSETAVSQLNQYHILGDPASRLFLPEHKAEVEIQNPLTKVGQSIQISASCPFFTGTGRFYMVDSTFNSVFETETPVINGTAETKMTVPTAFKHKQGYVRFFAIDELDKIPVNGADIFSLQDVLFDSAFVLPAKGDSLVFHIHITSKSGIKKLTCLCAGDSIPMKRKSEFWYQGSKYFSPAWAGYELPYRFQAVTDKISSSQIFKYYISYGFDTSIEKNTVELTGSEEVLLSAKISNYGGQKAVDIPVAFYRMEDGIFRHLSQDIVTLGPFATGIAKVPFSAEPGVTTIKIQIDPDSVYHDSDRNNNTYITDIEVFRFNYETETGISINGTGRDTLEIDSCFLLNLPAGILAQDCAVQVLPLDTISIHEQPQFKNFPGLHAYSISCQTPLHPEKSFFVRFRTDSLVNEPPETPQPDVNIFRFVEKTGKWLRLSTSRSGSDLMAVTEDFGQFAVLSGTDNIQPKIEFTIDGQPYTPNAYCSKTPQLSIFMQDENGIDISEKTLKLLLNGNTQTVELPDVISNGNQIMLDIYPSLSTGRNQISIQTADCFGNTTKPVEIVLNVAANFDIELLGNYPNPFSRNTTFAYNLTQPCEELWLKIYTASGRLIRHLDPRDFVQDPNPFGADYHELFWDGTDDFGDAVANGVYFFRISAQVTGKTVQKTGKLARIK